MTLSSLSAILMVATIAYAGGAVWVFDGYHRPGDVVESTTAVAWAHNNDLGTPQDGPYLLYLAPMDVDTDTWPHPPKESLLVGIVEVHEGPFADEDDSRYGPHHAVARLEIPDVPAGGYQIFHCNDPCTSTLGDIVGGWDLRVISGPDGRPPEDVAEDVRSQMHAAPLLITAKPSIHDAVDHSSTSESSRVDEPVSTTDNADVKPITAGGIGSDQAGEATAEQPAPFNRLWLLTAGVVALLLLVRIVRIQLVGRPVEKTKNEASPTDVSTDE